VGESLFGPLTLAQRDGSGSNRGGEGESCIRSLESSSAVCSSLRSLSLVEGGVGAASVDELLGRLAAGWCGLALKELTLAGSEEVSWKAWCSLGSILREGEDIDREGLGRISGPCPSLVSLRIAGEVEENPENNEGDEGIGAIRDPVFQALT